jgi:hypothetical protein
VNENINPNRFADSAGRSWEGRSFDQNAFADDDGKAPAELIEAIKKFRAGQVGAEVVVDQIRVSRLLVPLLANLGESEEGAHGHKVDKTAELSIVTVKSPDDQDSLVVFSSVESMTLWNKESRPVPTDAIRVALAAASQLSTRVVLDPGSESEFVLRRPAIAKIAQSLPWLPPEKNPQVLQLLMDSIAGEELVVEVEASTADPTSRLSGAELEVSLQLKPGGAPDLVRDLIERVSSFWSRSEVFASSVDSVSIKLRS